MPPIEFVPVGVGADAVVTQGAETVPTFATHVGVEPGELLGHGDARVEDGVRPRPDDEAVRHVAGVPVQALEVLPAVAAVVVVPAVEVQERRRRVVQQFGEVQGLPVRVLAVVGQALLVEVEGGSGGGDVRLVERQMVVRVLADLGAVRLLYGGPAEGQLESEAAAGIPGADRSSDAMGHRRD
nr:hypothetical protein [Microbispora sp. H11081]